MVYLDIYSHRGETLVVQAIALFKGTTNLPSHPVSFSRERKNLLNIHLADPDLGTPWSVDLLLGADVFSHAILQGQLVWHFEITICLKDFSFGSLLVLLTLLVITIDWTGKLSRVVRHCFYYCESHLALAGGMFGALERTSCQISADEVFFWLRYLVIQELGWLWNN